MSNWILRDSWHNIIGYMDSQEDDGAGALILVIIGVALLAIASAVSWVLEQINNYTSLDAPYRFIALYYFYTVVLPIRYGVMLFNFLRNPGLTQWPNLNIVIAVCVTASYAVIILLAVYLFFGRSVARRRSAVVLFLGPAIFSLIWFASRAALQWLFARA